MARVQVSLPGRLKGFIDDLVAHGTFKDPSEYVRTLIDRDRQSTEEARIEALLIKGVESGPSSPMTAADWDDVEQEGRRLVAARKARKAR
jgi:antitoxin ParD1/3/4